VQSAALHAGFKLLIGFAASAMPTISYRSRTRNVRVGDRIAIQIGTSTATQEVQSAIGAIIHSFEENVAEAGLPRFTGSLFDEHSTRDPLRDNAYTRQCLAMFRDARCRLSDAVFAKSLEADSLTYAGYAVSGNKLESR
jgi:hypothetical protein